MKGLLVAFSSKLVFHRSLVISRSYLTVFLENIKTTGTKAWGDGLLKDNSARLKQKTHFIKGYERQFYFPSPPQAHSDVKWILTHDG